MTQTETSAAPADKAPEPPLLPPYSGSESACAKCNYPEAFTRYRPALRPGLRIPEEFNGTSRRGPLRERLERACERCDFQWDEDLVSAPAPALRPATVGELAHAIQQCSPYPVHPQAAEHAARRLQEVLHAEVRTDHPMWAPAPPPVAPPAPARPPVLVAADAPTRAFPHLTSGAALINPERIENAPGPVGPVSPLGSAGFAQAAEG
ncbi:hypothetical protein ACFY0G_17440 [Streptomyces sp. NPDC001552]|uniref:hypothetical protein n=1 Tax=Streptomyces sp. NPDC001552 TaxID=3364587 RepID=UPI0036D0F3D9